MTCNNAICLYVVTTYISCCVCLFLVWQQNAVMHFRTSFNTAQIWTERCVLNVEAAAAQHTESDGLNACLRSQEWISDIYSIEEEDRRTVTETTEQSLFTFLVRLTQNRWLSNWSSCTSLTGIFFCRMLWVRNIQIQYIVAFGKCDFID